MNQEARFKLVQARTELLFNQCFFGQLAMRLRLVEDETCQTMYTDGERIGYNPFFVLRLDSAAAQWAMCHEVLHCFPAGVFVDDGEDFGSRERADRAIVAEVGGALRTRRRRVPDVSQGPCHRCAH